VFKFKLHIYFDMRWNECLVLVGCE